jgi:hypothetical protein
MANQVIKKAYYLRSIGADGKLLDFEHAILTARKAKPTVAESEITLPGKEVIRIQHCQPPTTNEPYLFLHLVRYFPGDEAPTLRPKVRASEDHEDAVPAPEGKEFKDGDSFLMLSKHHVLFTSNGISLNKSMHYLKRLLEVVGATPLQQQFDLTPVGNMDKMKIIHQHGVRAIELSCNAFEIGLPGAAHSGPFQKVFKAISNEIAAMVQKDDSISEQKAKEDILVNVELRLDGNTRASLASQALIKRIGESVLDDDLPVTEFAIITKSDERISPDEVRLQTSIKALKEDGSVSHQSVWAEFKRYFKDLKRSNLLEQ